MLPLQPQTVNRACHTDTDHLFPVWRCSHRAFRATTSRQDNWYACITQKRCCLHTHTHTTHTSLPVRLFFNFTASRPRASWHTQQHRQLAVNNCHLWVIHALAELNNEVSERAGDGRASRASTHQLHVIQQVGYCGMLPHYDWLIHFYNHENFRNCRSPVEICLLSSGRRVPQWKNTAL